MSNKLQELRKKLQEKENKQSNFAGDNALYPFWNIPYSTETEITPATVRFLPDGNEENDFFWIEVQKIKLTFAGIAGGDEDKEVFVQVPCVEMWQETCPILTTIRPWFKGDKETESLARKYWKKRSYVFQGFVRENPIDETDAPENPIRRFAINTTLFKKIKAGLMDPDMEEMPDDYVAGNDFKIIRTKQTTEIGTFANYDTSQYAKKNNSLTTDEVEAIEEHGLKDLSDFMPKKPDEAAVAAIKEMFEASVNGDLYDPERWASFYRPAGVKYNSNNDSTTESNAETTSKVETKKETPEETVAETPVSTPAISVAETPSEDTPPFDIDDTPSTPVVEEATESEAKRPPKDILADIKARAAAQKS